MLHSVRKNQQPGSFNPATPWPVLLEYALYYWFSELGFQPSAVLSSSDLCLPSPFVVCTFFPPVCCCLAVLAPIVPHHISPSTSIVVSLF